MKLFALLGLLALAGCSSIPTYQFKVACVDANGKPTGTSISGDHMTNLYGTRTASCGVDKQGNQTVTLYNSDLVDFQTVVVALFGALLAAGI